MDFSHREEQAGSLVERLHRWDQRRLTEALVVMRDLQVAMQVAAAALRDHLVSDKQVRGDRQEPEVWVDQGQEEVSQPQEPY